MATIRWCPIYPKWDSYQPQINGGIPNYSGIPTDVAWKLQVLGYDFSTRGGPFFKWMVSFRTLIWCYGRPWEYDVESYWDIIIWLVVWNMFLFFHRLGIIIPTDFHIFQRGWNHQPDNVMECGLWNMNGIARNPPSHGWPWLSNIETPWWVGVANVENPHLLL